MITFEEGQLITHIHKASRGHEVCEILEVVESFELDEFPKGCSYDGPDHWYDEYIESGHLKVLTESSHVVVYSMNPEANMTDYHYDEYGDF